MTTRQWELYKLLMSDPNKQFTQEEISKTNKEVFDSLQELMSEDEKLSEDIAKLRDLFSEDKQND